MCLGLTFWALGCLSIGGAHASGAGKVRADFGPLDRHFLIFNWRQSLL